MKKFLMGALLLLTLGSELLFEAPEQGVALQGDHRSAPLLKRHVALLDDAGLAHDLGDDPGDGGG